MPIKYLNRFNRGQSNPVGPGGWTTGFNYASQNYTISYGNGYFIVGGDGFIARSSDANTWEYKINTSSGIRGVAYANGLWVAVSGGSGNTGVLYTSSNGGASWTDLYQPANNYRRGVAYGNGVWVIICESRSSSSRIFTSTDGSTWTARDSAVLYNSYGVTNTISFGGGTFVLVCHSGSSGSTTLCFTSSDGIDWTQRTLPAATSWRASAYGNGVWVAVASSHAARSTDNGATWSNISGRSGTGVTYGDGYFVIAGASPAYSTDGINWTTISSGPPENSSISNHIAYGNGIFASVRDTTSSNVSTSPMSYILSNVPLIKFRNRFNVETVLAGTQKAIFGYGSINGAPYYTSDTNLVSNTGVVSTDTAGVGLIRMQLAAAGYGGDKAIFGYGYDGRDGFNVNLSITSLVSNTGVVANDTAGVGTARYQPAAAGYGTDKAIFGYGYASGVVSMTNLVSNTGVVATDTAGVGTARYALAAASYGTGTAIFGYGVNGAFTFLSMTNLVSNTGVVSNDTTGVGTARPYLAAASYGSDKAIFGYGREGNSGASMTNLVSNTGVVATDTTGVGTARYELAAAGYGSDKAIFGYGTTLNSSTGIGGVTSITNLVSNTGVVATDTTGVGTARKRLAAAGFSAGTIPAPVVMKFNKVFADPIIVYLTQKAIFGYGNNGAVTAITNLVSNTGVVANDTTGVGSARQDLSAAGYGADKALFGFGSTGTNTAITNLVSNTGVVSADTTGVGTARNGVAAAGYGIDKALFGFGIVSVHVSMTNLVSNTGVVSNDTAGVGTARESSAAAGYGSDKAIFGYGYNGSNLSITNLVSNTGVVATDTTGVGTSRRGLAATGYGTGKAIFGYGFSTVNVSITNLISNTGVVATDTTGVGTVRRYLAAAGYGTDKAIFGYGWNGSASFSITNLVSNTGVVASDTTGVGTARYGLAAAGYSTT
jgi:hypothetical protein